MDPNELGAFLKLRRGLVTPEQVGLRSYGTRRVTGLRREEVSILAGVSVDYYSRLEQGRERTPSAQMLNAIASALNLEVDARHHIFRLAGLAPEAPGAREGAHPGLVDLMGMWNNTPALIIDRQLDVLACNDLARALYSDFARLDNIVLMTFADPAGRRFFVDWERATQTCVANLRLAMGFSGQEQAAQAVVREAYLASSEFRKLWRNPNVRGKTHEAKSFRHTQVGDLDLEFTAFDVRGASGQQLIVYSAATGTPNAEKLQLLGTLNAALQQSESDRAGRRTTT